MNGQENIPSETAKGSRSIDNHSLPQGTARHKNKQRAISLVLAALLIVLSYPILFRGLGSYSLVNGDEGFYHYVARNMLETGNWYRLEFTGEHRVYDTFLNAPIQYWLRGNLIRFLGDDYFTMRICSAVAALLCVLAVYRLAAWIAGLRAGFLAGLAQLTTFQFVYLHCGRTGELEPMVCLAFTLACYTFLRAVYDNRSFLLHFICIILLGNLKAPLILLPIGADLIYFAVVSEHRKHLLRWLRAGLIVPLGFAWHIAQLFMIGEESFKAFASMKNKLLASESAQTTDAGMWENMIYYAKVMLYGAFPFVLVYPIAIVDLVSTRRRDDLRKVGALIIYFLMVIAFVAVLGKHFPWYVIPAYPFLSTLAGIWFARSINRDRIKFIMIAVPALLIGMLVSLHIESINPFAIRGRDMPLEGVAWSASFYFSPAVGVPFFTLIIGIALCIVSQWIRDKYATFIAVLLAVLLFGFAAKRIVLPFRHLDHISKIEILNNELNERIKRNETLIFPIFVEEIDQFKVCYFFADKFRIENAPYEPGGERAFLLVGERE